MDIRGHGGRPSVDIRGHSGLTGDHGGWDESQRLAHANINSDNLHEKLSPQDAEALGSSPGDGHRHAPEITAAPLTAQSTRHSAVASEPGEDASPSAPVSRRGVSFRTESKLASWGLNLEQAPG